MAFVVIGGGIAGISCAETLGTLLENIDREIILITPSSLVKSTSSVRQISQVLVDFDVKEKNIEEFGKDFPRIKVINGNAVSINEAEKCVVLENGEKVAFVKLAVCTGARPDIIWPECPYVIGIRDTSTARELEKKLSNSEKILVVGNGGIAMELVFEIKNCGVIWAVRDSSIGTTFLDPGAAEFLISDFNNKDTLPSDKTFTHDMRRAKYTVHDLGSNTNKKMQADSGSALGPDWHESIQLQGSHNSKGFLTIEYSCEVQSMTENKDLSDTKTVIDKSLRSDGSRWPVYITLSNGKQYGCDVIISATGVKPNIEVFNKVKNCKISSDGGVEVDGNFKVVGCLDIYAAGDICTTKWDKSPHWQQQRLWTQARQMGIFCAQCMANDFQQKPRLDLDFCFEIFAHVTKFFGHQVVLLGKFNGQGLPIKECELIVRVTPRKEYVKVLLYNGKMYGAVLIGNTDLEETFENLILNGMDLSSYGENLLHPDVEIEDYFD